jgi:hypothetical protein
MATNYPTSIDSFTNPTSGDTLDSPSHAAQHANINDAMVAVQTRLGTGADPVGTWGTFTTVGAGCTISSQACRYAQVNGVVRASYRVDVSAISGTVTFTLPVTASNVAPFTNLGGAGSGLLVDGSNYYHVSPYVTSGTTVGLYYVPNGSAALIVNNSNPVANWDNVRFFITYQAA